MKRLAVGLIAILFSVNNAAFAIPAPKDWSNSEWYQFIEAAVTTVVGEGPGHYAKQFGGVSAAPIMDVYSALSGVGSAVKPGLIMWLRKKAVEAQNAGDIERGNRYQAYETAIANDDNSRLKQLLTEYDEKRKGLAPGSTAAATAPNAQWRKMVGLWRNQDNGNEVRIYFGEGNELVGAMQTVKTTNYSGRPGDLLFTHGYATSGNSVKSNRGICYGLKGDAIKPHDRCLFQLTISADGNTLTLNRQSFQYAVGATTWLDSYVMHKLTYKRIGD